MLGLHSWQLQVLFYTPWPAFPGGRWRIGYWHAAFRIPSMPATSKTPNRPKERSWVSFLKNLTNFPNGPNKILEDIQKEHSLLGQILTHSPAGLLHPRWPLWRCVSGSLLGFYQAEVGFANMFAAVGQFMSLSMAASFLHSFCWPPSGFWPNSTIFVCFQIRPS